MYQRSGRIELQTCANAFMPMVGKSDAGIAERGRDEQAGQSQSRREVAGQELQQRAERQMGDDQQRGRRPPISGRSPLNGISSTPSRNSGSASMIRKKMHKQRRQLAGQRDDRIAAGAFQPGPRVAAAEFGADRIARGERDHHMDDHRQQRAQQELGVVLLRIDQRDGLAGQRAGRGRGRRAPLGGGGGVGRGRKRIAQPGGGDAGRGQELLVIEADHLRPAFGLQVALEIRRDIDRRDRLAGPDVLHRRRQRAGAIDDVQARRRRDVFDQGRARRPSGLRRPR